MLTQYTAVHCQQIFILGSQGFYCILHYMKCVFLWCKMMVDLFATASPTYILWVLVSTTQNICGLEIGENTGKL